MPRSAEILAGYCESDEYGRRKPESLSVSKMWAPPGGREDCPCADQLHVAPSSCKAKFNNTFR
ncbi:hypothetical protein C6A85_000000103040 [Mycobacterium sp. ITM-2017-0098]|nr:hypothetical protein C6A85_000000103040 [Mycobacterium sp. ITM-2017-0098]